MGPGVRRDDEFSFAQHCRQPPFDEDQPMPNRDQQPNLTYDSIDSPIGPLLVGGDETHLRMVVFAGSLNRQSGIEGWQRVPERWREARRQLNAYFGGELQQFDLPLAPHGTPFQLRAWQALQAIPYAQTRSYSEQANAASAPKAVRAIGAANGRNPLPIVIPCHRVIGKDGSLTGFGGGLPIKQWLLQHEQRFVATALTARSQQ